MSRPGPGMDPSARRVYRAFGTFFLVVGAVFLGLGLVRVLALPDVLRGDPLPVAALLLVVGGALRWTARERDEDA